MIEVPLIALFILWAISRSDFSTVPSNGTSNGPPTIESVTWKLANPSGFPKSFVSGVQRGVIGIQEQTENMTDGSSNPLGIWRNYVKYGQDPSTPLAGTFAGQNGKQNAIASANGWLNANTDQGETIGAQSIQTPSPDQETAPPVEEQIREVTQRTKLASNGGSGLTPINSGGVNAVGGYALQDPLIR